MHTDVTCIILAGGKSSRMGQNKALIKLGKKTVIERMIDIVDPIFKEILIITNSPEKFRFLGFPIYEDIYKYKGPLAGIHSGLMHSTTERNFVISCDIPLMTAEMIKYIVEFPTARPVAICQAAGYLQPLAGVYSKIIFNDLDEHLKYFDKLSSEGKIKHKKNCGMHDFLDSINSEIIYPGSLDFYSDDLFFNMNSREDYENAIHHFDTG
ncbi:Molybdenum cofactor guanylyltransferase [hydrothermal vent metagenome]|uniref:Molybdenum cofactor guanylyltransferase n=1 Tax=hydrothermal vent metagenome TaxID=652676 RepID=A0A3B1CQ91_9ZZZZ